MAAGCVGELEETTSNVEQENTIKCPPGVCSENSDVTARNGIWEANLYGLPDVNGVSLVSRGVKGNRPRAQIWDQNGRAYDLKVLNGRISGTAVFGTGTISGPSLVNASFKFQQNGAVKYTVFIDAVKTVQMPVALPRGGAETIEVYNLSWSTPQGMQMPTCPRGAGLDPNDTVVFEGDRIDTARLTMSVNADWNPEWINFGCGNSVIAKLRLLRKTTSNGTGSWAARQTALKMLTADYCGTGANFTRVGTAITWKDDENVVGDYVLSNPGFAVYPSQVEARWNEYGATCLNTPRLEATGAVPYISDYIHAVCLPLPCYDTNLTNPPNTQLDGAHIVSANY